MEKLKIDDSWDAQPSQQLRICARRTDAEVGWGLDLVLECTRSQSGFGGYSYGHRQLADVCFFVFYFYYTLSVMSFKYVFYTFVNM